MNLNKGWERCEGYRGKRLIVFEGHLECCIHEDLLSLNRPYRVLQNSRLESSYATLDAAKARVIELLGK
jgi:hypothetical protein